MSELKEQQQPVRVAADISITKNLGNYESIRVGLRAEDNARPGEEISDAIDRVYAELEANLTQKVREALED